MPMPASTMAWINGGASSKSRCPPWLCPLIWIGLALFTFIVFVCHVTMAIRYYNDYPIWTERNLKTEHSTEFPAVTICNLGPVLKSQEQLIFGMPKHFVAKPNETHMMMMDMVNTYYGTKSAKKYLAGLQINDMLVSCRFKHRRCDASDFTHHFDPKLGNCYTFNAGFSKKIFVKSAEDPIEDKREVASVKNISDATMREGLSLVLQEQKVSEIVKKISQNGVRIVIHDSRSLPMPQTRGFIASPGFAAEVQLKKITTERLGEPHAKCCNKGPANYLSDVRKIWLGANYTKASCHHRCVQSVLRKVCKCQSPKMFYTSNDMTSCFQPQYLVCMMVAMNASRAICASKCPEACSEVDYETDTTTSQLAENSQHLIKLTVYFQSMEMKHIEQKPEFQCWQLLGHIAFLWVMTAQMYLVYLVIYLVCCKNDTTKELRPKVQPLPQKTEPPVVAYETSTDNPYEQMPAYVA